MRKPNRPPPEPAVEPTGVPGPQLRAFATAFKAERVHAPLEAVRVSFEAGDLTLHVYFPPDHAEALAEQIVVASVEKPAQMPVIAGPDDVQRTVKAAEAAKAALRGNGDGS
jgi:hypothetical protein